jgi:hypothetical protein
MYNKQFILDSLDAFPCGANFEDLQEWVKVKGMNEWMFSFILNSLIDSKKVVWWEDKLYKCRWSCRCCN